MRLSPVGALLGAIIVLTACGSSTATTPPPLSTASVVNVTPSSTFPTATGALSEAITRTQSLQNYATKLEIQLGVERDDGRVTSAVLSKFDGSFRGADVEYRRLNSTIGTPSTGFPAGALRVIMVDGRTYARGPLPVEGADLLAWYQLDSSQQIQVDEPIYRADTLIERLFAHADTAMFAAQGAASLEEQQCDLFTAEGDTAIAMLAPFEHTTLTINPTRPGRAQIEANGAKVTRSEAKVWSCDGSISRVEVTVAFLPPGKKTNEVRVSLTAKISDLDTRVAIAAPSGALRPGETSSFLAAAPTSVVADARDLVLQGRAQGQAGQYEAAVATLTQAIDHDPQAVDALFERGEALVELERYAEAIDDYTQVIALAPDFATVYRRRGYAHRKLARYDEALADYSTALERNPGDEVAYLGRGLTYGEGLGDWQRAYQEYTDALLIDPDYTSAYHNRGTALRNLGFYQASIADYNEEIAREPDDPSAFRGRGLTYLMMDEWQKAIDDFDTALAFNPDDGVAYCNRGAAYLGLKEYAAAVRDSSAAIRLRPNEICPYLTRARASVALGDIAQARVDFERAILLTEESGNMEIAQHLRDELARVGQ